MRWVGAIAPNANPACRTFRRRNRHRRSACRGLRTGPTCWRRLPEQLDCFLLIGREHLAPVECCRGARRRRAAASGHQLLVTDHRFHGTPTAIAILEEDRRLAGRPAIVGVVVGDHGVAGPQGLDQRRVRAADRMAVEVCPRVRTAAPARSRPRRSRRGTAHRRWRPPRWPGDRGCRRSSAEHDEPQAPGPCARTPRTSVRMLLSGSMRAIDTR